MSKRLVTGDALNDILYSVKEYIDHYDLDFEDAINDDDAEGVTLPRITLLNNNIKEADVDKIIEDYFSIPK